MSWAYQRQEANRYELQSEDASEVNFASQPLLSIVIPVLNAAQDLPACLQSILQQTVQTSYEVIVVDGGSTDASCEIAIAAGARLLSNPHVRAEPGVAIGLQNARGQLIMVMAADNRMRGGDFIDRIMEPFEDPKVMASFPRVVSAATDTLAGRYINSYSDPFSHFVYGSAWTSIDLMLKHCNRAKSGRYFTMQTSLEAHPLLAAAQGCTLRKEQVKIEAPQLADDVLHVLEIIKSGGRIALVAAAQLEHHHVSSLRSLYRKYRARTRASLTGQQGYRRRGPYLSGLRRMRTFIWLPYSATLAPAVLHSVFMAIKRRDPLLLYHPVVNTVVLLAVGRELVAWGLRAVTLPRRSTRKQQSS